MASGQAKVCQTMCFRYAADYVFIVARYASSGSKHLFAEFRCLSEYAQCIPERGGGKIAKSDRLHVSVQE